MQKIDSWDAAAANQSVASSIEQSNAAKEKMHKYGFKLFDYQINTKIIQERFMQTLFWLEASQMELHTGKNTPLLQISYSAELLGVVLTFNMERFENYSYPLMYIDIDITKPLHLELKVDPQKIIEIEDEKLIESSFEVLFLKGAIEFGWF